MMLLNKNDKTPLYRQIFEIIRQDICNGAYKKGDILPSIRELSGDLQVSLNTVISAYQLLLSEGYVISEKGKGYSVLETQERTLNITDKKQREKKIWIDFTKSTTAKEVFPWSKWRYYINQAFDQMERNSNCYESNKEEELLKESLSRYLKAYRGLSVSSEQIILCSGTLCAFEKLARILTSLENGIAFADPAPAKVRNVFRANDFLIKPIDVSYENIDLQALKRSHCTSVFLPAEVIRGTKKIDELLLDQLITWMDSYKAYLIEYDKGLNPLQSISEKKILNNTIFMGTFDDILPDEIQCAYMVLPQYLLKRYQNIYGDFEPMFPISYQIALSHFMDDGYLFRLMRKVEYHNSKKRKLFLDLLKKYLPGKYEIYPDNYIENGIAIQLKCRKSRKEISEKLMKNNVMVVEATNCWYYKNSAEDKIFIFKYSVFKYKDLKYVLQILKDICMEKNEQ